MKVNELSRKQLNELKFDYFCQLWEADDEVLQDLDSPADIPDDVVFEHYGDVEFTDDDFICSCSLPSNVI